MFYCCTILYGLKLAAMFLLKVNRAVIIFQDILLLWILQQIIYWVKIHIFKHICNISSSWNICRLFDIYDLSIIIQFKEPSLTTWPHLHIGENVYFFNFPNKYMNQRVKCYRVSFKLTSCNHMMHKKKHFHYH